jgi:hypothetical protein
MLSLKRKQKYIRTFELAFPELKMLKLFELQKFNSGIARSD